ncbi:unnamed protein product, partial [Ectocarpus sp. 12 AP-2014]
AVQLWGLSTIGAYLVRVVCDRSCHTRVVEKSRIPLKPRSANMSISISPATMSFTLTPWSTPSDIIFESSCFLVASLNRLKKRLFTIRQCFFSKCCTSSPLIL